MGMGRTGCHRLCLIGPSPSWSCTPSQSFTVRLWHLRALGQWPQSGVWTLQLEAVTQPAVSRCQSRRGALSIHPESRSGSGRLHLSCQRGRHWKTRLGACSLLLTLMPGLIILLPFLSLRHCDLLSSDHLAQWRHRPEAQVTIGKLLPEERSGHGAGKRDLTGKRQQPLDPSPSSQASSHASVAGVIVYRLSGD